MRFVEIFDFEIPVKIIVDEERELRVRLIACWSCVRLHGVGKLWSASFFYDY
jgi:hypothetical protein